MARTATDETTEMAMIAVLIKMSESCRSCYIRDITDLETFIPLVCAGAAAAEDAELVRRHPLELDVPYPTESKSEI